MKGPSSRAVTRTVALPTETMRWRAPHVAVPMVLSPHRRDDFCPYFAKRNKAPMRPRSGTIAPLPATKQEDHDTGKAQRFRAETSLQHQPGRLLDGHAGFHAARGRNRIDDGDNAVTPSAQTLAETRRHGCSRGRGDAPLAQQLDPFDAGVVLGDAGV